MTALTNHTATTSITTTTSLSVLLHMAVVATVLSVEDRTVVEQAVGDGISIELISSDEVADEIETESAQQHQAETVKPSEIFSEAASQENATDLSEVRHERLLLATDSETEVMTLDDHRLELQVLDVSEELEVTKLDVRSSALQVVDMEVDDAQALVNRSTDASQVQHSILELLHSRISNEKVYPYLARRQRREGTTTVAFVLYPDGRIEQAQLINSSHTAALDRAAISAVKDIEPFHAARDYLQHAQRFQVDVVFSLL
jgi:TonB family protein